MTQGSNPSSTGPLAGVRILDMATVLAAPFAATLCADLGAEVVKLELPDGSDPLRSLAPVKDGLPLYWKVTNRGKKGITLDVRKPQGRALCLKLVASFDVLVENFRAGTLERWGIGPQVLFEANPRLVLLRLTGFGQSGPNATRPGFARIFEAMSGLTNLTGQPDGPPLHMNFPIGDTVAGVFGAFAITSELVRLKADPSARGIEIDLSATEALMRMLEPLAVEREQLGLVRRRSGNLASYTAPSNMYRTRYRRPASCPGLSVGRCRFRTPALGSDSTTPRSTPDWGWARRTWQRCAPTVSSEAGVSPIGTRGGPSAEVMVCSRVVLTQGKGSQ